MQLLTIPWFRLEPIHIPIPVIEKIPIQPFGILVAIGVILGAKIAERFARRRGLSPRLLSDLIGHVLIAGFAGGVILNIVFYEPEKLLDLRRLWSWPGLSSFGGFIGAVSGVFVWKARRKLPALALTDAIAFGLPLGWLFGRTGCFVVHDHPGAVTDFFLAVEDYNLQGQPRHDMGLYEVIFSIATMILFLFLDRKPRKQGFYLALLPLLYTPIRFCLDFLRAGPEDRGDLRYCGLTPGQYASMAFFGLALLVARNIARSPEKAPAEVREEPDAAGSPTR